MKKCYQCRKSKEECEFYFRDNKYYSICLDCRKALYCGHNKEKENVKTVMAHKYVTITEINIGVLFVQKKGYKMYS